MTRTFGGMRVDSPGDIVSRVGQWSCCRLAVNNGLQYVFLESRLTWSCHVGAERKQSISGVLDDLIGCQKSRDTLQLQADF